MMQELKKYQINILGESYTILSDESDQAVNDAVSLMNSLINEITAKSSTSVDNKKVAIFVALKLASKLRDLQYKCKMVEEKEKLLIQSIDKELSEYKLL